MKTVLRLYIGESWPQELKTFWALLATNGSLLQEGESTPSHWPIADIYEAVLCGAQTVWLHVRMPDKFPRGEYARLLTNALEEKMLEDPEQHHLTVTDNRTGAAGVIVISRKRLHHIVAQFSSLGRPLSCAYSELQTTPAEDGGWHMTLIGDTAILRRNIRGGMFLDQGKNGGSPSPMVAALATSEKAATGTIPTLTLHSATDQALPQIDDWETILGMVIQQGSAYHWYVMSTNSTNLLHNDFAPQHQRRAWLKSIKPAIWLAVAVLLVDILINAIQVGWQRHQIADNQQHLSQMFRNEFPDTPVIEPTLQLVRQIDQLRGSLGFLRSDDALILLAALTDSLGKNGTNILQEVSYENGVLEIVLLPTSTKNVESLQKQLAIRGFSATLKSSDNRVTRLVIRQETKK